MDFGLFLLIVFVTVSLSFIPTILGRLGLFKVLGSSSQGKRLSGFLGSNEPTDFMRGAVMVLFFVALGYFYLNGITTNALLYQINKPAIDAFSFCNDSFSAVQVGLGDWNVKCASNNNLIKLNLSNNCLDNYSLSNNSCSD